MIEAEHSLKEIRNLSLVLTARCNLDCDYCYQNSKNEASADWETVKKAIDIVLDSRHDRLEISFLGGEPLLEFDMMKRSVDYARKNAPPRKSIGYSVITNGTLMDEEVVAFLAEHRFKTKLSFDGIPEAQAHRGRGTFAILDHLLDSLREEKPSFFRSDLKIAITLSPATVGHLSDSVEYFLEKGIRNIYIGTIITGRHDWSYDLLGELDRQFGSVYEKSIDHYRKNGNIPVQIFQNKYDREACMPKDGAMCGACNGYALVVDINGEAYGCSVLAGSYQEFKNPFMIRCFDSLKMGHICSKGFPGGFARFPSAAREQGIFYGKEEKYSSYMRCSECPYAAECSVCPVSIARIPGNLDPRRVPDFACAFNMTALKYRGLFPALRHPRDLLAGPPGVEDEMKKWRGFAEKLGAANRARKHSSGGSGA